MTVPAAVIRANENSRMLLKKARDLINMTRSLIGGAIWTRKVAKIEDQQQLEEIRAMLKDARNKLEEVLKEDPLAVRRGILRNEQGT